MERETKPDTRGESIVLPVYKEKGDAQECGNYKRIKLMSHIMKIFEWVMDG